MVKDVTVSAILTHARRFPMMAERQVVIVKEAQDIVDLQKEEGSQNVTWIICNGQYHLHYWFYATCISPLISAKSLGKKIEQLN
jgi:DNA polymerase-3 subunit delta